MTGGVALGPVLSGVLLEHFWWGSVFLVNLPAMVLLLVARPAPAARVERRRGAAASTCSASLLSLAAVLPADLRASRRSPPHGAGRPRVACDRRRRSLLGAAVRAPPAHRAHPMIDRRLFRDRGFSGRGRRQPVGMFALVGYAIFTTQYLQSVLGKSPLEAALWSLVPSVGVGFSAPFASGLAHRSAATRVAAGGLVVAAAGFGILTQAGTDSPVLVLVGAGVLACGLVAP